MDQLKIFIKYISFLKDLTDEEVMPFLAVAKKHIVEEKKMIFMHEEPITHVYFLVSGKVKVFRNDLAGREQIMSVKQRGDMFPHVGFFRKGNYPAHATAIEDAELYSIAIRDFEEVLLNNPYLSIKLCKVLGDQIVDMQQRLEEMTLKSTNERILLLLLRLGETHGNGLEEGWVKLNTRFTNVDLANMIGTTRESVNRLISQLRKEQAVKLEDGIYFIALEKVKQELFK